MRVGTLNVGLMTGKGREAADMMHRRKGRCFLCARDQVDEQQDQMMEAEKGRLLVLVCQIDGGRTIRRLDGGLRKYWRVIRRRGWPG